MLVCALCADAAHSLTDDRHALIDRARRAQMIGPPQRLFAAKLLRPEKYLLGVPSE
jgi:hypothetical protein